MQRSDTHHFIISVWLVRNRTEPGGSDCTMIVHHASCSLASVPSGLMRLLPRQRWSVCSDSHLWIWASAAGRLSGSCCRPSWIKQMFNQCAGSSRPLSLMNGEVALQTLFVGSVQTALSQRARRLPSEQEHKADETNVESFKGSVHSIYTNKNSLHHRTMNINKTGWSTCDRSSVKLRLSEGLHGYQQPTANQTQDNPD